MAKRKKDDGKWLYETKVKIKKPLYAFSDLKKYSKEGKVDVHTLEYLKRKYYKGLML